MTVKYASAAGNWSTIQWKDARSGGNNVTKPGVGDTADANAVDVTLDEDFTCDQIQTLVSVGGRFLLPAGAVTRTITTNYVSTYASINYCTLVTTDQTLNLVGNISASGGYYLQTNGGTINISGNATSTGTTYRSVLYVGGAGANCNIGGNLIGNGSAVGTRGVELYTGGVVTLGGLPLSDGASSTVFLSGGTLVMTGSKTVAADQNCFIHMLSGTLNLTDLNLSCYGKFAVSRLLGTITTTGAKLYERKGGQICAVNGTLPKIIAMPYPLGA